MLKLFKNCQATQAMSLGNGAKWKDDGAQQKTKLSMRVSIATLEWQPLSHWENSGNTGLSSRSYYEGDGLDSPHVNLMIFRVE